MAAGALCWTMLASVALSQDDLEAVEVGTPERIEVYPAELKLTGPRQRMQLVVTGHYAGGILQDLTRVAEFVSSDEAIVKVTAARVAPQGDGAAEIVVRVGGQEAKVAVAGSGQGQPEPVSFEYGTLAALSKQGCNAGACHGSPSGKGGFRLSLRAFDPTLDRLTLIREDFGRRTNPLDPAASLLLLKPLMKVPHGGGLKLHSTDPSYAI